MRTATLIGRVCVIVLVMAWRTTSADGISAIRVADGLSNPVYVTSPPGDAERLFILEQFGDIKILDLNSGQLQAMPFVSINAVDLCSTCGLHGMTFHPDFANNGYFYVNEMRSDPSRRNVVRRYQVSDTDPNLANPESAHTIMTYEQPGTWHYGNWLGFGPDGYLYHSIGDGRFAGGIGDPSNLAQDVTERFRGKILRIDVGPDGQADDFPNDAERNYAIPRTNPFVGESGDDEIWAYGLRNPWRVSFDRLTGDLYIGDVGQVVREEINFQPASSTGGENYGWRVMEGTRCNDNSQADGNPPCHALSLVNPIHDYDHDAVGRNSVTGGYVYRGPVSDIQGQYFFADFEKDKIWSLLHDGTQVTSLIDWTTQLTADIGLIEDIASFGEDSLGNLYLVDLGDGEIFRIVPEPTTIDFNTDGKVDVSDIDMLISEIVAGPPYDPAFDISGDAKVDDTDLTQWRADGATHNGFGEPYLLGDSNLDGSVNATDLNHLALNWLQSVVLWSGGDFKVDGVVDSADLSELALNWQQSIPVAAANASVPEPSALLLTVVGFSLVWRQSNDWVS